MAHRRSDHIQRALTSVLPRRRIRELARRLGVVQRRRKLDIVALVHSLVLGFSTGERRSLSGLRRAYLRTTGVRLAPSSFHARFSAPLAQLMRTLLLDALERLGRSRPKTRAVFAPFVEVLAVDGALLRLHNALEPHYPSVWTHYMKASAKLGVVINVIGRGAKSVTLTHGSKHDVHLLKPGPWMKRRLIIFDLAFYSATLFKNIEQHGGYFLCRMKKNANPTIIRSHREPCRTGTNLRKLQNQTDDDILDVQAEMTHQLRHKQRPLVTTHHVRWRCVAIYNHELDQWHRYVTNMPPSVMRPAHFTAVYAARWEIELLFRELKCSYRIEQMPSGNKHVTEALIYAALLTLVLSRRLYRTLTQRWKIDKKRLPFDRWAVLVSTIAQDLLDVAITRHDRQHRLRRIERFLRAEATDPNLARIPLPYRAQQGICQRP